MRRTILLGAIALLLYCSFPTFAQIKLGPSLDLNSSSMIFSGDGVFLETSARMALGLGATAEIPLPIGNQSYLQTGLHVSGKGYRYSLLGFSTRLNLAYLEMPLLIRYETNFWKDGLFALAGPYLGYFFSRCL